MTDYALRFEHVSKRYPRGSGAQMQLRQDIMRLVRSSTSRRDAAGPRGTLALEDVSFEVGPGESLGIVGPNGAGKSTALKLATRISYPTAGRVLVRGRVAGLIEVTGGIHPELSGRENVWLFGRILGMRKADVRRRFDEIVEFAELGPVLDTPVKLYSSGMQLRLAFSIASHLEPDIFVVDEALAVGDAGFQAKCVERMMQLIREQRTLVLVSHQLHAVEAICNRALFLLEGRVRVAGPASQVVNAYLDWVDENTGCSAAESNGSPVGAARIELRQVTFHGRDGRPSDTFSTGDDLEIRMKLRTREPMRRPHVTFGITDGRSGNLVLCTMAGDRASSELLSGDAVVSCRLRSIPFLPRVYSVNCSIRTEHGYGHLVERQPVGSFRVVANGHTRRGSGGALVRTDAPIHVPQEWSVRAE